MVQAVYDTVTEEQQSPSQKKGGFGWGAVTATIIAAGVLIGAAFGLSESGAHQHLQVDNDSVDNVHGFLQGKNDFQQHGDKLGRFANNVAGGLNNALQGGVDGAKGVGGATVKGAEELYKTAFGIGSTKEAQELLRGAVDVIDPASVNDNTIKAFLQSGAESARYDKDHWVIRVEDGNGLKVLKINEPEFLAIDPRVGGGANLMPSSRTFDGMHRETIENLQKAMIQAKAPDLGDVLTPKMLIGAGVGAVTAHIIKPDQDAIEKIAPTNSALPKTRIVPQGHLLETAFNAPRLNQAFASMT